MNSRDIFFSIWLTIGVLGVAIETYYLFPPRTIQVVKVRQDLLR